MNEQPTKTEIKSWLKRGAKVKSPDGEPSIFLEFGKTHKDQAWILKGGPDGPKIAVPVSGIVKATWGITI